MTPEEQASRDIWWGTMNYNLRSTRQAMLVARERGNIADAPMDMRAACALMELELERWKEILG